MWRPYLLANMTLDLLLADIADGSILTSGGDSLVCFEKTGQRRWLFRFNRKTEVVADNQTFTYSARQVCGNRCRVHTAVACLTRGNRLGR